MSMIGETPKTYCDKENGCMFCDLLFCDGSRKKAQMFSVGIATTEGNGKSGCDWKVSDSKNTAPKLKQCPFCGGTPKIDTHYGCKDLITIRCEGCGAELTRMTSFGAGEAIDRVSEAWNRRVNKNQ